MELFETDDYYIIQRSDSSLWCSRKSGLLEAKPNDVISKDAKCLGIVHGVIGKVKVFPDSEWRLLLIKQIEPVDKYINGEQVFKVLKVAILPLTQKIQPVDLDLQICANRSHARLTKPNPLSVQGKQVFHAISSILPVKEQANSSKRDMKNREKLEKRILEELTKMFNISDFYYFSPTADLTNTMQRQNQTTYDRTQPLWRRSDDRFFWNKGLLTDLILSNEKLADSWIQPVIQGFYESQLCCMNDTCEYEQSPHPQNEPFKFVMRLISRRSRHRAGTRYKRRGLDRDGACANYVETEQIVHFGCHRVSYVQLRGSIPVFWSQTGYKYRPPPTVDKGEEETTQAFSKHFSQQVSLYGDVACLSLVERLGRERIMADIYLKHALLYNSPRLAYVAFDFHHYCRGMQFDNVALLTDAIKDIINHFKYCWVDSEGMICEQLGVFRTNCIDCLDRTNVVQTTIARILLDLQVRKLGMLTPEEELPPSCIEIINQLWANNGDAISRQYAGTAAMKGDYTRTGKREFAGLMRDGVKSANRYLIHRFKDMYRQAAIDIQLGQELEDDIMLLLTRGQHGVSSQQDEIDYIREKAGDIVSVIEEARNMLIEEPEQYMGGWAAISLDECDPSHEEMETILLLSNRNYYVVSFDDDLDCLTHYQKIPLDDLCAIDIGLVATSLFQHKVMGIRMWFTHNGNDGYFHTLKIPNVRAFNNTLTEISNPEEVKEILWNMAATFRTVAGFVRKLDVLLRETKIDQKRPKQLPKHSIQKTSIESTLLRTPHKIASMATTAVTKAAASVKKQLSNQMKKINLSPSRTAPQEHTDSAVVVSTRPDDNRKDDIAELDLLQFVDLPNGFDSSCCINASPSVNPPEPLMQTAALHQDHKCGVDQNMVKLQEVRRYKLLKTHSTSLPDLMDASVRRTDNSTGFTTLKTSESTVIQSSTVGAPPVSIINGCLQVPLQPAWHGLHHQNHYGTEPSLNTFNTHSTGTAEEMAGSPNMKAYCATAGDDNPAEALHSAHTYSGSMSALSKIRSGLSQVSQLIPNTSPQTRRRRQLLEAQVQENIVKSNLQYKNCTTHVLLL